MKKRLVQLIRPWVAELVIRGLIPSNSLNFQTILPLDPLVIMELIV